MDNTRLNRRTGATEVYARAGSTVHPLHKLIDGAMGEIPYDIKESVIHRLHDLSVDSINLRDGAMKMGYIISSSDKNTSTPGVRIINLGTKAFQNLKGYDDVSVVVKMTDELYGKVIEVFANDTIIASVNGDEFLIRPANPTSLFGKSQTMRVRADTVGFLKRVLEISTAACLYFSMDFKDQSMKVKPSLNLNGWKIKKIELSGNSNDESSLDELQCVRRTLKECSILVKESGITRLNGEEIPESIRDVSGEKMYILDLSGKKVYFTVDSSCMEDPQQPVYDLYVGCYVPKEENYTTLIASCHIESRNSKMSATCFIYAGGSGNLWVTENSVWLCLGLANKHSPVDVYTSVKFVVSDERSIFYDKRESIYTPYVGTPNDLWNHLSGVEDIKSRVETRVVVS